MEAAAGITLCAPAVWNRFGLEGRAPFWLRLRRAAPYRRFTIRFTISETSASPHRLGKWTLCRLQVGDTAIENRLKICAAS
jgi:hypothetical protein